MKFSIALAGIMAGVSLAGSANAAVFVVDALAHSSDSGAGAGLATVDLVLGDAFSIAVDEDDLWNAGDLPRWSNADGLTGNLFATGTDESGQAAGTQIGTDFGLLTLNGFSAPYGALVGQIGTGPGSYRLLGTSFAGPAWATGTLILFYWDTFTADNTQFVSVDVVGPAAVVVPEPATWAMMIVGFGAAGSALRRRRELAAG